jgi:cytochrome P450
MQRLKLAKVFSPIFRTNKREKQARPLPPQPKGHWLLGNLPQLKAQGRNFYLASSRILGGIYRVRVLNSSAWMIIEPALVEEVLVKQRANFSKGRSWEVMRKFSGNGLVTSEGDLWLRQRRMIQPAFHRECIEEYARLMTTFTHRMLNHKWATFIQLAQSPKNGEGMVRDVYTDMKELTLEIVCGALFDLDIGVMEQRVISPIAETTAVGSTKASGNALGQTVNRAINAFDAYLRQPFAFPVWLPTKPNRALQSSLTEIDDLVYNLIAQRRADPQLADRKDLLSLLVSMQDSNDGSVMRDKQVRDEVLTLLSAGHDTTAVALSWTLYMVATYPHVQEQLLAELQALSHSQLDIKMNSRTRKQPLECTVSDLAYLKYHTQVIKETLRLYPSFWLTVRDTVADTKIGSYDIKKGSRVCVLPWVTHRDPRFFPDPEEFRPERWTSEFEQSLPRFAYFPFGGGARQCIGNAFAMQEAVLVLATILSQYEVQPASNELIKPGRGVVVRPHNGLPLLIKPRFQSEFPPNEQD